MEIFADPIIKEERLQTLRGPYALRLILRKFTGKNIYSGQRVLQVRIRAGGGAGTGTPISSTPALNRAKVDALIPILEAAHKAAIEFAEKNQISQGIIEYRSNIIVELFWIIAVFSERQVFKAELPLEYGGQELIVDVVHNRWRNNLICVVSNKISPLMTMPAIMNCAQFEIFKNRVVHMAQEI
jgi:hypothetical protein